MANQRFKGAVCHGIEEHYSAPAVLNLARKCYAERRYAQAIVIYTEALEFDSASAVLLSNRAFAHLKMENFGCAVADSTSAIEADPTFVKVNMLT